MDAVRMEQLSNRFALALDQMRTGQDFASQMLGQFLRSSDRYTSRLC